MAALGSACALCLGMSIAMLKVGMPIVFMLMMVAGASAIGANMLLKSEDEKQQKLGWWSEAQSINQMVVCGMITLVTGLGVLVGPRLVATVSPAATSFFEKAATSSVSAELQASYQEGLLMGFEIGSLAQPWHGLIALVLICLCVIANDPFFG